MLLVYSVAAVGAIASASAGEFYKELIRPDWAPPGWLFGPVWTLLYTMVGVATWLIWRQTNFVEVRSTHLLNVTQLAANGLWSWLFFTWNEGALAFVEIIILWILIAATIRAFWKINRSAALLLIPYLLWVTFASILAYKMWMLNPSILG
tara:strand:- start:1280 stop:1729 length:450 start_codon:yes stop_codon:yes gene_type:complete